MFLFPVYKIFPLQISVPIPTWCELRTSFSRLKRKLSALDNLRDTAAAFETIFHKFSAILDTINIERLDLRKKLIKSQADAEANKTAAREIFRASKAIQRFSTRDCTKCTIAESRANRKCATLEKRYRQLQEDYEAYRKAVLRRDRDYAESEHNLRKNLKWQRGATHSAKAIAEELRANYKSLDEGFAHTNAKLKALSNQAVKESSSAPKNTLPRATNPCPQPTQPESGDYA